MSQQDVEAIAKQMGITRAELRARVCRALENAGLVERGLSHRDPAAGDHIMGLVKISVEVNDKGQATYYVQDTRTGDWRLL